MIFEKYNLFIIIFCEFLFVNAAPRIKFKELTSYSSNFSTLIVEKIDDINDKRLMIAVIINNHAHALPTFLASLEKLKYPIDRTRCHFWVIFDKSTDNSKDIFTSWLHELQPKFEQIVILDTKNDKQTKSKHPELNEKYFSSNLKKRAFAYALDKQISYVFFIHADVILTNEATLDILVKKKKTIVAPALTSFDSEYSTFWTRLNTDDNSGDEFYDQIYHRKIIGCFKTLGVHDCYLVDLSDTSSPSKFLDAPDEYDNDDVNFSVLAQSNNILLHVCNRETFGYIISNKGNDDIENLKEKFVYMRMEHLLNGPNKTYNQPLPITKNIDKKIISNTKTKLGFDKIYVINLERRTDRRVRIESALNDLGIEYTIFNAIDALKIDIDYIKSLGIQSIPNYTDPYNNRPLNYGEISCFLSHYFIWKEMIENKYDKIIILEDDARFVMKFKSVLLNLIKGLSTENIEWELMYLGRKIMKDHIDEEVWFEKPSFKGYGVIKPSYSHWTVAYALTLNGAKKLFNQEPLKKLVPVDEYLPIMFDRQPNKYWASFFHPRDVIALSIQPQIISPTHYFGEPSYISDTEFTQVVNTSQIEISSTQANKNVKHDTIDANSEQKSFEKHVEL